MSTAGVERPVKVAVVTGGHSYEVVEFHQLFRSLEDIDAYIQHMDDFCSSPEAVRDGYDVVLFYTMLTEGPGDEGLPWYAGKPLPALAHLGETWQGIVQLHHSILAYPRWEPWSEMVGIEDRGSFGYYHDEVVPVSVVNDAHPITRGVDDWEMIDETYTMNEPGPGSQVLLTTNHPQSMRALAWTRSYKKSRVFCFQSGHDNQTWIDPNFRVVLRQGILWAAASV
jgi:hypothetical protein